MFFTNLVVTGNVVLHDDLIVSENLFDLDIHPIRPVGPSATHPFDDVGVRQDVAIGPDDDATITITMVAAPSTSALPPTRFSTEPEGGPETPDEPPLKWICDKNGIP